MLAFFRRHPLVWPYVLIVVVAAGGFYMTSHERDVRAEALVKESAARERSQCETARDTRIVLRAIVKETETNGGLNLTSVPEFENLTPETQDYIVALEMLSNQPSDSSFSDRALALITIPDCDEEIDHG